MLPSRVLASNKRSNSLKYSRLYKKEKLRAQRQNGRRVFGTSTSGLPPSTRIVSSTLSKEANGGLLHNSTLKRKFLTVLELSNKYTESDEFGLLINDKPAAENTSSEVEFMPRVDSSERRMEQPFS